MNKTKKEDCYISNFTEVKKYFAFLFFAISVSFLSRISLNYQEFFSDFLSIIVLDTIFLLFVFLFDEYFLYNIKNPLKSYFILYLFSGFFGLLVFDIVINLNFDLSIFAYIFLFMFRATIVFLAKLSIDNFFKIDKKEPFFIKVLTLYVFIIFLSFVSSFFLDVQSVWPAGIVLFYFILNIMFLRFLLKINKRGIKEKDNRPVIFY